MQTSWETLASLPSIKYGPRFPKLFFSGIFLRIFVAKFGMSQFFHYEEGGIGIQEILYFNTLKSRVVERERTHSSDN